MTAYVSFLLLVFFIGITVLGSKYLYFLYLKHFTSKMLYKLNCSIEDLKYSYEEIIYFISLPSNNPKILNAQRNDLYVEKEFLSPIYPTIKGIKVILKNKDDEDILIAYLAKDNFRLPILDKLMFYNKINMEAYLKIASYKLVHHDTINEIIDEVYAQLTKYKADTI